MRQVLPVVLAAALSSCGILYTDIKVPRGYRSASQSEVKASSDDPVATGMACQRSLLFLVAWGDSSYASSVKSALGGKDGIMYDVKADLKVDAYLLGLYTKVCTVINGRIAKP